VTDTAIRVDNLGKKYTISHQQRLPYQTLRDSLVCGVRNIGRRLLNPRKNLSQYTHEDFWALRDVAFEIKQGDRVGIIGRNGAGKSTLLKVLSRITEPTTGLIALHGRVASLLEVGTGFHPELTGRENIYLNGAILGMTKTEIRRKFDEIVAFAEVEKFLDTPVKRYSSGMYVRLAFAVAAHLEPEILIVDEVLAVGDAQFQKKCLGKMEDVGKEGRTVLFVSHNMSAIQMLCDRCLVFQKGTLIADQTSAQAVQIYLRDAAVSETFTRPKQPGNQPTLIAGQLIPEDPTADQHHVQIELEIFSDKMRKVSVDVRLTDGTGIPVGFGSLGALNPNQLIELEPGINQIALVIPTTNLAYGSYLISLDLTIPDQEFLDRVENCLAFDVNHSPSNGAIRIASQSWGYGSYEIPITQTTPSLKLVSSQI